MLNSFEILTTEGLARAGRYQVQHGVFETPNFMPVATQGTIKGIDAERIPDLGAQIVLVNTYHLFLRPGSALVEKLGGIHKFMAWNGPILSDSGGFQVFSLKDLRKVSEEGVEFKSHLDGSKQFLSPEKSIQIQEELGVDIAMVLDECLEAGSQRADIEKSMQMTIRWAQRSLAARRKQTAIFAITQGGFEADLRKRCAEELSQINFDGFAIGGLSVGEEKSLMYDVLSYHPQQLPSQKIRYLMGVGTPEDIVTAVANGVDLFDCVMPTRSGRFGRAFVDADRPYLNIRNARFAEDAEPLDKACKCLACRKYSKAYLHHLFKAEEMLGPVLLSIHNLTHYQDLMRNIRSAIKAGQFEGLYNDIKARWWEVGIGKE